MTLENFLENTRDSLPGNVRVCVCVHVYAQVSTIACECVCVCTCAWWACVCVRVWACCVQRQTCPRGRKTLEIGYCITEAIYLFWGLTYLIPLLNPVGVNALAFPIIWLSVTQRESGLPLPLETGFSMQVAELQLQCVASSKTTCLRNGLIELPHWLTLCSFLTNRARMKCSWRMKTQIRIFRISTPYIVRHIIQSIDAAVIQKAVCCLTGRQAFVAAAEKAPETKVCSKSHHLHHVVWGELTATAAAKLVIYRTICDSGWMLEKEVSIKDICEM